MDHKFDVCIVGAGVSGACAASTLAGEGLTVALIDPATLCAPCFKAEKLERDQIALLDEFRLLDDVRPVSSTIAEVVTCKYRKILARAANSQFGFHHHEFVNALLSKLSARITRICGRVAHLQFSDELQEVVLEDGRVLACRLVVVASGANWQMHRQLQLPVTIIEKHHSTSFGFSLKTSRGRLPYDGVNFLPDRRRDLVDFLTLFPVSDGIRGNLFTYQAPASTFSRDMRRDGGKFLGYLFGGLAERIGDYTLTTVVAASATGLWTAGPGNLPGYVVIGDACQSVCPATGTGLSKVLTDVAVLRSCVARWFATAGMPRAKTTEYFLDPRKLASDLRSLESAAHLKRTALSLPLLGSIRRAARIAVAGFAALSEDDRRIDVAPPAGVEPTTYRLGGGRSIH